MAKDYSFDVVCRTDLQEAANAVNQASKEIGTRYDFKGSKSSGKCQVFLGNSFDCR